MNDFYKEHKRYKRLEKELIKYNLEWELMMVVGDAIQYGISVLEKNLGVKK